jgi:hypothetical protein
MGIFTTKIAITHDKRGIPLNKQGDKLWTKNYCTDNN